MAASAAASGAGADAAGGECAAAPPPRSAYEGLLFDELPGFARSAVKRGDYSLVTHESRVYGGLPGWTGGATAAYIVTPALGAHFAQYMVTMPKGAAAAPPASPGVERLAYVVSGACDASVSGGKPRRLAPGGFVYAPPGAAHTIECTDEGGSEIYVVEREYVPAAGAGKPEPQIGEADSRPLLETPGEVFELRKLLPQTAEYDFNIHVMDFKPGEYLNVKEVHYNQHALLMLEGKGIYKLGDDWHSVRAGDAIYMAPFVPQWYAALGYTRTRYIIYKDTNRDPLTTQV